MVAPSAAAVLVTGESVVLLITVDAKTISKGQMFVDDNSKVIVTPGGGESAWDEEMASENKRKRAVSRFISDKVLLMEWKTIDS